MNAVVLVGGEGTRLRPLTLTTPKPLLPLMGRPFLHHVLDHLAAHGVHRVILSSPYLAEIFEPFIAARHGDPKITWITESEPLGTGGAVLNALDAVGQEPFFVLNGDILTDLDLGAMRERHEGTGAGVSIATIHAEDARPFGLIASDASGRIEEFREKPTDLVSGDVNAGTYLLDPAVLRALGPGGKVSIETEIFPRMIAEGVRLQAYPEQCYWMDLGTPEKFLQAHWDLLEGRVRFEQDLPAPYVEETAVVDLRARLGRWVIVSADARIAADAEVDETVVLAGATIGAGARVRTSIVGPGAQIGAGAQLIDCVIGQDQVVGAGTAFENARIPSA